MLRSSDVRYLVIGGYAVNFYGFARATADLDIWIATDTQNAAKLARVLHQFGFATADAAIFSEPGKIIRLGVPPIRLEILTSISGVDFADCYSRRMETELDGIRVDLIHLDDLKRNKEASGRLKDRLDLEQLG